MPPQIGPATNDFMRYDILDGTTVVGRVVVTGSSPSIPQAANTAVWSWTDSSRTTFPSDFRLVVSSGGTSLSHKWTFEDGPIPDPGTPPANPGTFTVHRIKDHQGNVIGYFWNKGTTNRIQYWSALPGFVDANGMLAGRDQGLWFSDLSPPTPAPNWRWRNDTP